MIKNKWIYLSFFVFLLILGRNSRADIIPTYPHTNIQNDKMRVEIYLPDAQKGYYRGTRFEWSGIVQHVYVGDHTFYGDWKKDHNPTNHDDVNAIASEFGMNSPLGYKEAKPGDPFVKIGVGELIKSSDETYGFANKYNLAKPFGWKITQGTDWIEFHQTLTDFKGWGYDYTKRIELDPDKPIMLVIHTFKNSGKNEIDTDYYCHNFTIIDDDPIGPDYQLTFPFPVKPANAMEGYAAANGKQINFLKPMEGSFHTFLHGWEDAKYPNGITILNKKRQAGITIQGNQKPHQFALWTTVLATCPEAFIPIKLKPGDAINWQDTYAFWVSK